MIPNPKCSSGSGCGPWTRPMKKNPDFKGKWIAPMIKNPKFIKVWEPRKISNPEYFEDEHPSSFSKIGAIGFEIWTMQSDILFDNIYIGHSEKDAELLAKETFDVKKEAEPKPKPPVTESAPGFSQRLVSFLLKQQQDFPAFFSSVLVDPYEAIRQYPFVFSILLLSPMLVILLFSIGGGDKKKKDKVVDENTNESKDSDESKDSKESNESKEDQEEDSKDK